MPDVLNTLIHPRVLHIIVHNNHAYKINITKSLEQLYYNGNLSMIEDIKSKKEEIRQKNTCKFLFRNFKKEEAQHTYFVDGLSRK